MRRVHMKRQKARNLAVEYKRIRAMYEQKQKKKEEKELQLARQAEKRKRRRGKGFYYIMDT